MPGGCGRYPPCLTTVQSGSIDIMVMAASLTGWGKIKSERVQPGGNSTELAWLLSLKGSLQGEAEGIHHHPHSLPTVRQQSARLH